MERRLYLQQKSCCGTLVRNKRVTRTLDHPRTHPLATIFGYNTGSVENHVSNSDSSKPGFLTTVSTSGGSWVECGGRYAFINKGCPCGSTGEKPHLSDAEEPFGQDTKHMTKSDRRDPSSVLICRR
ncbi:hypothetical protein EYF80_003256 [Liparis tanakae]|uniref:Uncharacterized protein n=1 Tax=Liparis tanakae TaxID=230148 RepID=A0A4Z2J8F1_9TELE|nr:hypothetical protein EYF80_003256 [Liparis tanakae]